VEGRTKYWCTEVTLDISREELRKAAEDLCDQEAPIATPPKTLTNRLQTSSPCESPLQQFSEDISTTAALDAVEKLLEPRNVLDDDFMSQRVKDNRLGFVWLGVIAKDRRVITAAGGETTETVLASLLASSKTLELSKEHLAVRWKSPFNSLSASPLPLESVVRLRSIVCLMFREPSEFIKSRVSETSHGFVWLGVIITNRDVKNVTVSTVELADALANCDQLELTADRLAVRYRCAFKDSGTLIKICDKESTVGVTPAVSSKSPLNHRTVPRLSVRVCTYNVLTPGYASDMVSGNGEHALEEHRLPLLKEKLREEIKVHAIICLQELSLTWQGKLHAFFAKHDYLMIASSYNPKIQSGFMGVAIAWPRDVYSMREARVERAADVPLYCSPPRPWKSDRRSVTLMKEVASRVNTIIHPLRKSIRLFFAGTPKSERCSLPDSEVPAVEEDPWPSALLCENQIVSIRLEPVGGGMAFCVSTYHAPCVYWQKSFMNIHGALAAQAAKSFAESTPFVLTGDFNSKPDSSLYRMLTTQCEDDVPPPSGVHPEMYRRTLVKLRSALAEAHGSEPRFTTYSHSHRGASMGHQPFQATIDYIFISPEWAVTSATNLPCDLMESAGFMPNSLEPSDHALIAATIEIENPSIN
jgi:endonuclease/exonuclease/phosphatase family metal-dependent hydrolase